MGKDKRTLSPAELKRKEAFEKKTKELEEQGYKKKDLTIGVVEANVLSIIVMLPIVVLLNILYFQINKQGFTFEFDFWKVILFMIASFVLIVVHEGVHGVTWGCMAKEHFQAIEFGVIWSMLTPYCTCKSELKKGQYLIGAIMPTLLVGILPTMIGIMCNSPLLYLVGQLMVFGGGGDALISLKLLFHKEKGMDSIYMDHPYECGIVVFERTV